QEITAVMFFVPAVAAMSGNVGLQSSMTLIRALGMGQVQFKMIWQLIRREIATGFLIGLFCGLMVGLVATLFADPAQIEPLRLGVAVGSAMIAAMIISTATGTIIPLLIDKFGQDPAVGAGPFITTL